MNFSSAIRRSIALLLVALFWVLPAKAIELEEFGKLPSIRSMSISPDGKHIAFIRRQQDQNLFLVMKLEDNSVVGGAQLGNELKARTVYFAANDYVILLASDTQRLIGYNIRKLEVSGAFAFSLKTKKIKILLNRTKGLHPAQSGLGQIVGVNTDENVAYMPAFIDGNNPPNNLFKVDLKSGIGRRMARGKTGTIDWFVSGDGAVLAREDFMEREQKHRIYAYRDGKPEMIYEKKVARPDLSIQAVTHDEQGLLFIDTKDPTAGAQIMSLADGAVSNSSFKKDANDVEGLITDINRKLSAVIYSQEPYYYFPDDRIQLLFKRVRKTFKSNSVSFVDASQDNSSMLFKVSGNIDPETYMLFNSKTVELSPLATGYPAIGSDDIGEVEGIRYDARDGLSIPAIITWPANSTDAQRKNLPLLVLPHGGPESYDGIGFDWWAQYFASKGYLILQPNFRGSSGYGREFMLAGRGKWGKEMQDDVSDGVLHLIEQGRVDAERVCIMGASYGGYSALAGGAYTPDMYRCVISVAGVSDLPRMLREESRRYGSKHWVNSYWRDVIGDSKSERDALKSVSPVYAAESFKAPVLLIHGKDDTVVPIAQSRVMHKALKSADKMVKLVTLKGEDHWLSTSEMRTETLREMAQFIQQHNPAH